MIFITIDRNQKIYRLPFEFKKMAILISHPSYKCICNYHITILEPLNVQKLP